MKNIRIKCLIISAAVAVGALFSGCADNNGASGENSGSSSQITDVSGGNIDEVTLNKGDLVAEIEIKDFGTIKAKLFPEAAPVGVENFQKLCESGYYKGKNIHRVMKGFMFQGGSLNGDGTGGNALVNGGSFGVEKADNMRHFYGALCYANAGGQNSTQFYIVNNNSQNAFDSELEGFKSLISQCDELIAKYKSEGVSDAVTYYTQYKEYYQDFIDKYEKFPEKVKDIYNQKGGTPQLDGDYTVFGQVVEGFDVIDTISAVTVENNSSGEQSKPVNEIIISDIRVFTVE